jgi:hypothetical protein
VQPLKRLARQGGDGDRHVAQAFAAALRGHDDVPTHIGRCTSAGVRLRRALRQNR